MLTSISSLHYPQKSGLSVPGGPAHTQPLRKQLGKNPSRFEQNTYFAIQFVGRICSEAVIVHEPVMVVVETVVVGVEVGTEVMVEELEDVCI